MNLFAMIGMPGTMEMVIIAGVALLLFGGRLPTVARSIGQSIFELKRGLNEAIEHDDQA